MKSAMYILLPDSLLKQILEKEIDVENHVKLWAEHLVVEPNVLQYRLYQIKKENL